MDLGGASLLVLRTGLQGHGSQQECRCGQDHRGLSHQSLLFQGCRIEATHDNGPRYTPSGASFYDIASSICLADVKTTAIRIIGVLSSLA
jgi:hypothetical protein